MSLRWSILALVGIALLPLVQVTGLVVRWAHGDERQDLEQALLERARALAVAVDREVEVSIGALEGLATSVHRLDARDLSAFYEQARRAKAAYPRWLSVTLYRASTASWGEAPIEHCGTPYPCNCDGSSHPKHAGQRVAQPLP
jgi:hypothetical protein